MQYSFVNVCLLALASSNAVLAQVAGFNAITKPTSGEVVPAGKDFTVTWQPSTPAGKVSLVLLQGASNITLQLGDKIASAIDSSAGSFTWSVPASLTAYNTFGIKLQLDSNPETFQYSNFFSISGLDGSSTVTQKVQQISTLASSTTAAPPTSSASVASSAAPVTAAPVTATSAAVSAVPTFVTIPSGNSTYGNSTNGSAGSSAASPTKSGSSSTPQATANAAGQMQVASTIAGAFALGAALLL